MLVGYARVSTSAQDAGLEAQIRDLKAAKCDSIYGEMISSVAARPEFEAAIQSLKAGDTLVVAKIDRFARSNQDFWKYVDAINAKGAYLRILNLGGETIDTKSATGRLILTVFAGFAQFEREIMLERQTEGVAKAKADGKYKGRKPMAAEKRQKVCDLRRSGATHGWISQHLGLSRSTVIRILNEGARN